MGPGSASRQRAFAEINPAWNTVEAPFIPFTITEEDHRTIKYRRAIPRPTEALIKALRRDEHGDICHPLNPKRCTDSYMQVGCWFDELEKNNDRR